MLKYAAILVMLAAAGPAFAQAGASQSPPSPNAANSAPTPPGSEPPGATNMPASASPNVSPGTTVQTQPVPAK